MQRRSCIRDTSRVLLFGPLKPYLEAREYAFLLSLNRPREIMTRPTTTDLLRAKKRSVFLSIIISSDTVIECLNRLQRDLTWVGISNRRSCCTRLWVLDSKGNRLVLTVRFHHPPSLRLGVSSCFDHATRSPHDLTSPHVQEISPHYRHDCVTYNCFKWTQGAGTELQAVLSSGSSLRE